MKVRPKCIEFDAIPYNGSNKKELENFVIEHPDLFRNQSIGSEKIHEVTWDYFFEGSTEWGRDRKIYLRCNDWIVKDKFLFVVREEDFNQKYEIIQ